MSYSRSTLSNRYSSGYSRSSPAPPAYDPPITTGTTDEILDLRRQIKRLDNQAAAKTRGRHHWTNIKSGSEITSEFNNKYPSLSTSRTSHIQEESCFPYPMIRPPPVPPSSTLCYSNIAGPSYSNASYYQPQRVSFQQPSQSYHHHHYSSDDDDSFDDSTTNQEDERIQRALQHIDHASRILENY